MIVIENLHKAFGDVEVLKGVNLHIKSQEVVALIGPSGSGKSTLLRCMNYLEEPTSGTVTVAGTPLDGEANINKVREEVGMVFQRFNLFPHMSVLQNITDAQIHVLKTPKDEAVEIARKLLADVGLSEKENAYPCELSGGQQQRVSIARSLALKPKVLLFDEPTSALDPELTGEILAVIKQLALEKMTMIVVTHEMAFARDISDKIIFMADGVIVEEGEPKNLINNPQTARLQDFLKRFSE